MKLVTFEHNGRISYGVLVEDRIVDIRAAWPRGPRSLLAALEAGDKAMGRIAELASSAPSVPADQARLLAPLAAPPKIIAMAGNYAKHIKESRLDKGLTADPHSDTTPRPFLMPTTCIANPGDTIAWPAYSTEIDYEAELTVVIGRRAKAVSPAEAPDYIAGYTIANDVSARSVTFAEGRARRPWDEFYDWLNGKWADGFCPIGPCIVTADAIGDPRNLDIRLAVNGEIRQNSNTRNMIFDVYEMVSFLSHLMTLTPGDIIATGTPEGVGMGTGRFLNAGDEITATIEGIGDLTVTLGERPEEFYKPCPR
ncbi:MAG: fumarylacetoacetate hydrolase family protein [Planctomycetes bacterium]|nr:fumarylacetoacetate hydrolase family protein [Planctomycetota bacterium]